MNTIRELLIESSCWIQGYRTRLLITKDMNNSVYFAVYSKVKDTPDSVYSIQLYSGYSEELAVKDFYQNENK